MHLGRNRRFLAIGIDVGISTSKIVAMEFSGKNVQRVCADRLEIFGMDCLERLVQRYPRHEAAVAIQSSQVDIRYLNLPHLPENDLESMIGYEMEPQLGYPLEEACYDFTFTQNRESIANRSAIIAFACKKENVLALTTRFASIPLNLKVVDVAAMALMNFYREITPDFDRQSLAGVDIGEKSATILIARKGNLYFTRDFPLHTGGRLIERAGEDDLARELALEIRRTIQYCQIQHQLENGEIQTVLLSGDRMGQENLAERMTSNLGLICRRAGSSPETEDLENSAEYAIAAGLAYRLIRERQ